MESLGKDAIAADFTQFPGGANNLVFSCEMPSRKIVIKAYPQIADRFQAEADFLIYANQVAPDYVPRVYEVDPARRLLIMEHLEGARFESGAVERVDVERASAFLASLNRDPAAATKHIRLPAAEGFLKLSQHAENVGARVGELDFVHLPQPYRQAAQALISETKNGWSKVRQDLEAQLAASAIPDELPVAHLCVSPSDFGFHNAIRCKDGIKFYDFEFAGWDDPAKTLADFFLQPRIPVSRDYEPVFRPALTHALSHRALNRRAQALRPVLHLKWVTIVLAVLRPIRLQSILSVAVDKNLSILLEERFNRARRLLSQRIE